MVTQSFDSSQVRRALTAAMSGMPACLDDDGRRALRLAIDVCPWFTAAKIALFVDAPDAPGADELRRDIALEAASPATMAFAARGREWADFYPAAKAPEAQDTEGAIDRFLEKYGHTSPEEDALLERMIFNPAPDYAEMLARQEQDDMPDIPVDTDSEQGRIATFILGHHPGAPERRKPVHEEIPVPEVKKKIARPRDTDKSLLSESLANVFIKQGRFKQAYDIICSLNLNYPKKSAYFADQLRFLQKVMANERYRINRQSGADNTVK